MAFFGPDVTLDDPAWIHDSALLFGKNCIVAGHTFVKANTVIPDNSIVMGSPGKVVRTHDSGETNQGNADFYYKNAVNYRNEIYRIG